MIGTTLVLFYCLLMAAQDAGGGTISGTVVNASCGNTPVGGAAVVLRAEIKSESLICGETVTDDEGRFVFYDLPQGEQYSYLPGANRDGVHFPGPRVQLTAQNPRANVDLKVCDCVSAPSPLVIRRQDVSLRFQSGALSVTESIIVDNPTQRCYVGATSQDGGDPVTLQLAIPSNFERTTFQKEFFGRRFILLGDKLVTSIPWPPGQRELKFTYVLPIEQGILIWQRPLDLPCEQLRVSIQPVKAEDVTCNLGAASLETADELVYQSRGEILPKGRVIRVESGRLSVPFMTYARWLAVALLVVLFFIGGSLTFMHLRRGSGLRSSTHYDVHKNSNSCPKTSRRSLRV